MCNNEMENNVKSTSVLDIYLNPAVETLESGLSDD